jgi:Domain of unknown function (DUF4124)
MRGGVSLVLNWVGLVSFIAASGLVGMLSSHHAGAADAIYKCTSSAGAISYSKSPCPKNTPGKTVTLRKPPKESADALAAPPAPAIPVSETKAVEEQVKNSIPRRTPFPQVPEKCRTESFALKRDLDQRFASLRNSMTESRIAMAQNDRDLREAETSKVGLEWSRQLQTQRSEIQSRIDGTDSSLAAFYTEEKQQLESLVSRCKK